MKHSTLLFGLAVICVLFLISFKAIFDIAFSGSTNTNASTNTTKTNGTAALNSDPLVTVVPDDVLAGSPQPLSSDPQIGSNNPMVTIVEFGDFECSDCADMSPVFAQLVRTYPNDVRLVWKDFPLPNTHLFSQTAANAARCAQDQGKFWEYHDTLLEQQDLFALNPWKDIANDLSLNTDTFSACLDNKQHNDLVVQGYFIARTFSLEQAPAYFINGTVYTGKKTYDELKAIVDAEIAAK